LVGSGPGQSAIKWSKAIRIVATRCPAVDLWEGLPQALWERLDQLEAMTNPRLSHAPAEASSFIQWPFSNPRPGRFSTESLGAFYAAHGEAAAIAETVHYQAIRCREDHLDPHDFDMRVLAARIEGRFHDVRGAKAQAFSGIMEPDFHRASRILAEDLARAGSAGILFDSVRDPAHGACVAAFTPSVVLACGHLRYLTYRWTGEGVRVVFEKLPYSAHGNPG
jgi:hypothetical protein